MEKPWLIQRASFKDVKGPITGVDMLLHFDYMGAAEFEFGALPASLKEMCRTVDLLEIFKTSHKCVDGQGLFLLCTPQQKDGYEEYLKGLVDDKIRLKESTGLGRALRGESSTVFAVNHWWDLDNHVMFCLGKENCAKVLKGIKAVRDKKKSENIEGWF